MNGTPVSRIWIIRRGNGRLQVTPSPAHLAESFTIRNLSGVDADVRFPDGYVDPATFKIPPTGEGRFTLRRSGPVFFEYDVTFAGGLYAEGGSKPGAIIDP